MILGRRYSSRSELRSVVFDFAHGRCEWPSNTVYSYIYRPIDGATNGGVAHGKQRGEAASVRSLLSAMWPMVPCPDQSTEERIRLLLLEGLQSGGELSQVVRLAAIYEPEGNAYQIRGQSVGIDGEPDAPSRSGADPWSVAIDGGTRSPHQRGQERQQAGELDGVEPGGSFEVALRARTGRCPNPASELAHIVSSGMGGDPKHRRDTVDNVFAACPAHARVSDGLPPPGGGFRERNAEYGKVPGVTVPEWDACRGFAGKLRTADVMSAFARWLWTVRAQRKLGGE